ncbi:MAG: TrmH family RNA methyltransferase [Planctomycetota bacterium]
MSEVLTSVQNPRVKRVVRLRDRRARDQEGVFVIEGYREILRAVEQRLPIQDLFTCAELFLGENEGALIAGAVAHCGAVPCATARTVFQKMSYRDRPDGLLAIAPQPNWSLSRLPLGERPLYVVATSIEKPGNLGTILRSSDAVGVTGVIVCDPVTDIFNPNVVRASVGTLFTVPIAVASTAATLAWLRAQGVWLVATSPAASTDYSDVDLTRACAIILGSEQYGLPEEWLAGTDQQVRIPMHGRADSINVAMAATVLTFEAQRQRRGAR